MPSQTTPMLTQDQLMDAGWTLKRTATQHRRMAKMMELLPGASPHSHHLLGPAYIVLMYEREVFVEADGEERSVFRYVDQEARGSYESASLFFEAYLDG